MGRLTERQAAVNVARIIGRPLKPYQIELVEQANARAEDGSAYAHQTVVILLPRQVGKTSTIFAMMLGRMHTRRAYGAAYTAQTGISVTHVFTNPDNGWLTLVDYEPQLARHFRGVRSQGREQIRHVQNRGSYLRAFPPTPGRLRGNSLDAVVLDECQEHTQELGQALLADVGPVFTTRPRRQLILMGTAPDGPASWWTVQLARARAGHALLIEYGTWPEDADIDNPELWAAHHPGLRAGLTDIAHLQSQLVQLGPERFAREIQLSFLPRGAPALPVLTLR